MATTEATKKRKANEIEVTFISIWDGGIELRSRAIFHKDEQEIEVLEMHDVDGLETLEKEYIIFPNGFEEKVCPICHEGIMLKKYAPHPVNDQDKSIYEIEVCSRKDCENK
ncbi:MAG TPA: hypothetical protein P5136_01405 [Methanofastidiosum sp.]|nr:hypothetical protein [Methanofastidiosum sp.]